MANQALTYTIPENYRMLKELGEGCYGRVIKCFKRDTKETVAVKILKQRHSKHRKTGEVLIMEKLRCLDPDKYNIVRCHEWFHRNDQTFVVYEVLDMSLYDYMCKMKRAPLPLNGIRTIIKDVATALNALKDVGLIHTDLKMDNVMLVDHQRQPFRVKLIDFGLTLQTSEAWPGLAVQPLWHRSPEIILGLPFTEAIDIWSLGSMVAEMLLGFTLFPGRNEYDVLRFITDLLGEPPKRLLNGGMNTEMFYHGRRKYFVFMHWTLKTPIEYHSETGIEPKETRKHRLSSLDELKTLNLHQKNSTEAGDRSACVDLLKEMLQMDPRDRITPSKILAHPFITRSYFSPSSKNETAAAATSQAARNRKDTAETKADDRCHIKLPPGVIMVQPAEKTMQIEGASKQSSAVSRNEIAAAETSQAASNSKDTAESEADDSGNSCTCEPSCRCPIKLPPGVIMVQPAEKTMQTEGAVSPQAVQNKMADCPKATDDTAHILEPVGDHVVTYDSGLVLESHTGSAKTSPAGDCSVMTVTSVPPNCREEALDSFLNQASLPTSEVSEPKEKKKKKGIRGFFSTLKRKFLCCFHAPEDDDE